MSGRGLGALLEDANSGPLLYKVSQVAELIGVNPRTIYRDLERLNIEPILTGPKSTKIKRSDVLKIARYRGKNLRL